LTIETKPWDATEVLNTPADIAAYLETYIEDGSDEELLRALGAIVRSHGKSVTGVDTLRQAIEDGDKSGFGDAPFDFDGFLVRMQTKYGPQV